MTGRSGQPMEVTGTSQPHRAQPQLLSTHMLLSVAIKNICALTQTHEQSWKMDWARDVTGISESDYRNVYKYGKDSEEKYTTVVRMTTGDKV